MKQKFRQLFHIKLKNVEFIVHFIRACAVLNNLSLHVIFDIDEQGPVPQLHIVLNEDGQPDMDDRDGVVVRENVMNNLQFVI